MAIFSFSLKTVSRKAGSGSSRLKAHSAVQSAAYLATTSIKDQRTGEVYNFRHGKKLKDKAESTVDLGIMLPTGDTIQGRGQDCRGVYSDFWSMIEKAERRGDSHVAHAMMGALPAERALGIPDHEIIVETFCREMSRRYRTAIHAAIHYDHRHNPHVHMLMPTRELVDGKPAAKIRVLDNPRTAGAELRKIRELWAECVNRVTAQHGIAPVSPLTLKAQGIDRKPGEHRGAYLSRLYDQERALEARKRELEHELVEILGDRGGRAEPNDNRPAQASRNDLDGRGLAGAGAQDRRKDDQGEPRKVFRPAREADAEGGRKLGGGGEGAPTSGDRRMEERPLDHAPDERPRPFGGRIPGANVRNAGRVATAGQEPDGAGGTEGEQSDRGYTGPARRAPAESISTRSSPKPAGAAKVARQLESVKTALEQLRTQIDNETLEAHHERRAGKRHGQRQRQPAAQAPAAGPRP